ncbi:MAG: hypothetical protein SFU83_12395 [Meiothermus sp.]|nr:hypothetical protein [Meiothermus sp.]
MRELAGGMTQFGYAAWLYRPNSSSELRARRASAAKPSGTSSNQAR